MFCQWWVTPAHCATLDHMSHHTLQCSMFCTHACLNTNLPHLSSNRNGFALLSTLSGYHRVTVAMQGPPTLHPYLSERLDGDDVVGGGVSLHQACLRQSQDALHGLLGGTNRTPWSESQTLFNSMKAEVIEVCDTNIFAGVIIKRPNEDSDLITLLQVFCRCSMHCCRDGRDSFERGRK